MKTTTFVTLTAAALVAVALSGVDAKEQYVQRLPNGANVQGIKALGHSDTKGDSDTRNAFGKAFDSAGKKWTTALCQADTDGDGQTNGQELGDPCCEWTEGGTPRYTDGVSHPGDASKTADKALWSSITCPSTTPSPSAAQVSTAAIVAVAVAAGVAAFLNV